MSAMGGVDGGRGGAGSLLASRGNVHQDARARAKASNQGAPERHGAAAGAPG
eukprot:CAMPEP_0113821624 /NCGR_PEP_ID=MMETSP0328-20130328/1832_1 /TAXON_ID=39455 /ORGANISM="Alexandrium minutum" /LENGTH=51 /DNA_ID=CAMNT_0000789557 /DNA_START=350 /DNA_END=501 /DNA_ORIENTATION=+ /assembly_acc=CAM_ASM_000350